MPYCRELKRTLTAHVKAYDEWRNRLVPLEQREGVVVHHLAEDIAAAVS